MECKQDHSDIVQFILSLPKRSQDDSLSTCAGCAFEAGYENGLNGRQVLPEDALRDIDETANKKLSAKCPKSAYLKGYELGTYVANMLVQHKGYSTGTQILKTRRNEKRLLCVLPIDSNFIIGIFQGSLSTYDMIVKYWKYDNIKHQWGYPKQPKHIHWVVDMMIKQEFSPKLISRFVDSMKFDWDSNVIKPITNTAEQESFLDPCRFYRHIFFEYQRYASSTALRGEYTIPFLIAISELLMTQERTNYTKAFMFRNLLGRFEKNDFYGIISTATHNGR